MGKSKTPVKGAVQPAAKKPAKLSSVDKDAGTATIHGRGGAIPCAVDESPSQDEQVTD